MKKLIGLTGLCLLVGACTSETPYGRCVGLNDDKNPNLVYKYNGWNIGMAVVFSGFIAPPIVVVLNELQCPIDRKSLPTGGPSQ